MPSLSDHQSSDYLKLLYIGDSSTGKTGSLVSLIQAGYKLKILDMDNGLDSLVQYGRAAGADLSAVEYETYRDEYRSTKAGPLIKGTPKAFTGAMDKLTEWGQLTDPQTVFVLDTLSTFGRAAFEWAKGMNPTSKDPRQWYGAAQQAVETTISMLTSPEFKLNVIVMSHVNYKEIVEGVHKGYASAIGTALGPSLPKYFNTLILAEAQGSGQNVKRKIKTVPTGVVDLKSPSPTMPKELPLESGLATIFSTLKGK